MTFIKSYFIERITKGNRNRKKEIIELQCDFCDKNYLSPDRYRSRSKQSALHFCSKQCSSNSMANGKLKNQCQKSLFDKYGSFFVETKDFKKKSKKSCLAKFGVEKSLSSKDIRNKIKKIFIEKYGKETYTGTDDHKSKLDYKDIARKAWKTKIKNGTCSKSEPEEKLYELLIKKFGSENVLRQEPLLKQWIDFYIKSLDLYIQVDGIYWHGLNRDIEHIKLGLTSQDKKIYKQILRDKKLDQYVIDNNLRLIRITDEQLKTFSDEEVYSYLEK